MGFNKRLADYIDPQSLPEYDADAPEPDDNSDFEIQEHAENDEESPITMLNEEQRFAFDSVTGAVRNRECAQRLFFLDGPGGTGKTFVYNAILHCLRAERYQCMAMATSGIAACLLKQGRTAHSSLAIPLKLHDRSTCSISVRSALADRLRRTDLILWDEAPMASRYAVEAVDRTLQDILGNTRPFGGMAMLSTCTLFI
jgi:ATP-dependent DNA helicase PIF1